MAAAPVAQPRQVISRAESARTPQSAVAASRRPHETRWWLLVVAAVAWNLVHLGVATVAVSYLNDSSINEQMVRSASRLLQHGQLPLTSWFPYLGLGSPQYLHYQSLPAIVTGAVGLLVGDDVAFRWSLYLLLSLWPLSVYMGGRLFGINRAGSACAAAMSPFLMSAAHVGYEQPAYLALGYGVWSQLWASLTLPLAWGFSWRAIRQGRHFAPAVALIALTMALHFETGYLAVIPVLLWPLLPGPPLSARVRRAAVVLGGSLLASAWVTVPLIAERTWAAKNAVLQGTSFVDGYGAPKVLGWLASGRLLDWGRLPVVTAFTGVGVAVAVGTRRRDQNLLALLIALAACLVLSFGRTTFGSLVGLLPGSGDIFFRRFMMGAQLSGLLLAGVGAAWCMARVRPSLDRVTDKFDASTTLRRVASGSALGVLGLLVLSPAWTQLSGLEHRNAAAVTQQQKSDRTAGGEVNRLVAFVGAHRDGRVYAGQPTNWGNSFTVGAVPVFKYLESRDVDEVGYTLRTSSLMTGPEYYFNDANPSDYALFGVSYLILPSRRQPPVPAHRRKCSGEYCLWRVSTGGYFHVGQVIGTLTADRTNVGTRSIPLLQSQLPQDGAYLRVMFGRKAGGNVRLPTRERGRSVGRVQASSADLSAGEAATTVTMRKPGVVVLSASFDPGWHATVDGRKEPTIMIAPALVGVRLGAGSHRIEFQYVGYGGYAPLFALCFVSLAVLLVADMTRRQARPRADGAWATHKTAGRPGSRTGRSRPR